MTEWQKIETAPERQWIRTKLEGEEGENVCAKIVIDGDVEWIEKSTGRTTVTHHSFAAPSHWKPLKPAD